MVTSWVRVLSDAAPGLERSQRVRGAPSADSTAIAVPPAVDPVSLGHVVVGCSSAVGVLRRRAVWACESQMKACGLIARDEDGSGSVWEPLGWLTPDSEAFEVVAKLPLEAAVGRPQAASCVQKPA